MRTRLDVSDDLGGAVGKETLPAKVAPLALVHIHNIHLTPVLYDVKTRLAFGK